MATPVQRLQAIANALVDGTATTAQMTRVIDAYVAITPDDELQEAFGVSREQLNNAQKAQVFIEWMRREVQKTMRYDAEQKAVADSAPTIKAAGDEAAASI